MAAAEPPLQVFPISVSTKNKIKNAAEYYSAKSRHQPCVESKKLADSENLTLRCWCNTVLDKAMLSLGVDFFSSYYYIYTSLVVAGFMARISGPQVSCFQSQTHRAN